MNSVLHKAGTRGHAAHGWLDSWHTFSFGNFYDPQRVHFGALRVLNDDTVAPGMGFGKHPHDNMEIISIPLSGSLHHGDDMGNNAVIRSGDVQIMSAGTGVVHSEKNNSSEEEVKFLQIWVFPNKKNVPPRYDQKTFNVADRRNRFVTVVSPIDHKEGVNIHQDAWFSLGSIEKGNRTEYKVNREGNGVYAFVLEGTGTINGVELERRDGLGLTETDSLIVEAGSDLELLLMEVPMQLS